MISIERAGNRIHLKSPYSDRTVEICRSLRGGWSGTEKAWTFPLSLDVCRLLRAEFGPELKVGRELSLWARGEVALEESQTVLGQTLSGTSLARVPELYPALAKAMEDRPYQHSAARFIAEGRSVLVADTPGLGKTLETIAGVVESGTPGPYLVVAPQVALDTAWEREILSRVPDADVVVAGLKDMNRPAREKVLQEFLDWHKFGDVAPGLKDFHSENSWVIVNIEMLQTKSFWVCPTCGAEWKKSDHPKSQIIDCGDDPAKVKTRHEHKWPQLFEPEWGAIIMDECQRSLIRTSGFPTQTRNGAKLLRTRPDGLRVALSGTPMRGKPQRLWGTLNWLNDRLYTGYWAWVQRYWSVTQEGFAGAMTIGELLPEREELLSRSLNRMMIRRTKLEVSPELPPKAYCGSQLDPSDPDSPVAVWLPMEKQQAKAYRQMLQTGSADISGGQTNPVGILAEMTRLKQFANSYGAATTAGFEPRLPSNKFNWLLQFLQERNIIDPDDRPTGKVVVVSQFTGSLGLFENALREMGVPTLAITGSVTGRKRTEAQDLFNDMDSGFNVLFLNTTAGGVAITLDSADDMIFLDETHVPDDQEQAEERINNRRPEEKVATRRYWYLKSLGTIDESIARANAKMDKSQKDLLDVRRGVPYLREVMEITKGLKG